MSDIRVNTISAANGTGPVTLTKQEAAKHWCYFVGTGTISINDSFNTASLTDHGTGGYSCNFTNNMGNANFAILATCNLGELAENGHDVGSCRIATFDSSGSSTDAGRNNTMVLGDLA